MLVPTQRMLKKHTPLIIPQDAYFMVAALTIHTTQMYIPQGIVIDGTNVYVKLQNVFLYLHKIVLGQAQKKWLRLHAILAKVARTLITFQIILESVRKILQLKMNAEQQQKTMQKVDLV